MEEEQYWTEYSINNNNGRVLVSPINQDNNLYNVMLQCQE